MSETDIPTMANPPVTDDEKLWAMLAHVSPVVCFAIWGPIIAMLVKQDSAFVKYHATQALVYQIASIIVISVVTTVTCGFGAIIAFLPLIGSIWLGVQSYGGSWEGYPLFSAIGKAPPVLK